MTVFFTGGLSLLSTAAVGLFVLSAAIVWYYLRIVAPYSKFPSWRMDIRLFHWIFKRKALKIYVLQKLIEACKKYEKEGMCVIWCGQPFVFIYGEEAVKQFLNEPAAADKPNVYDVFKCVLGNAIFVSSGEKYKKLKKLIIPAFHAITLKDKVPILNRHSDALVKKLSELNGKATDEASQIFRDSALRVFIETSLGINENSGATQMRMISRLQEIVQELSDFVVYRIFRPWLHLDVSLHIFPSGRRIHKLHEEGYVLTKKLLEEIESPFTSLKSGKRSTEIVPGTHGDRHKLLSEILIEEHLREPSSFTMKDLLDQTNDLVIAGYETIAFTLEWCLFMLGCHQDIQEEAYQEVVSSTSENMGYEELRNLEFLECVIKETLRLYPLGPIVARRLRKDVQCGKYKVPKNSTLAIFVYMLHRNPEIYPDPEKFNPQRFREKNSKITPWNYVAFVDGVRGCLGKAFAILNVKILLAHILRNFQIISIDRKEDVDASFEILLIPAKPIRFQFVPRQPMTIN